MPENKKRVILLTQELSDTRTSVEQIKNELENQGCDVREILISDAEIKTIDGEERLFYKKKDVTDELSNYDAVLKRSWDGGFNSQHGMKIQKYMESKGLYPDNSYESQRLSHYKDEMIGIFQKYSPDMIPPTKIINNQKELEKFIVKNSDQDPISKTTYAIANIIGDGFSLIVKTIPTKQQEELPTNKARWVVKPKYGTAGNGIQFMNNAELLLKVSKGEIQYPFILQERIKSDLFFQGNNEKDSSHLRIILSRGPDGIYEYLGGLKIGKRDSLISNISSDSGTLVTEILDKNEIPPKLLQRLSAIAAEFGINQTGFDLIKSDDGKYFVLELNYGPGVTGKLLDEQDVAQKYVGSFIERLNQVMQNKTVESWLPSGDSLYTQLKINTTEIARAKTWTNITTSCHSTPSR